MDAELFDLLARKFGLQTARRAIVSLLVSGTLGSLLSGQDEAGASSADSLQREDDQRGAAFGRDVAAEKRKKRKKKKKKKNKNPNSNPQPGPRDQAPPCTATSCPLPPQCSASVLETCVTALHQQLLLDIEPCRAACTGGDSPACRACLEPIAASRQPEIQACIVESCGDGVSARRAGAGRSVMAESESRWWIRLCDKPCCYRDRASCIEDFDTEFKICMVAALIGCFAGPGCAVAMVACVVRAAYENSKCEDRYGCADAQFGCRSDDTCCPASQISCGGLECCAPGESCTTGTYQGVLRASCCTPTPGELGACDGVCCGTPSHITKCCPGNSNPCNAASVPC